MMVGPGDDVSPAGEPGAGRTGPTEKCMRLRYRGTCRVCAADLPARTEAVYERSTKTVRCVVCEPPDAKTPPALAAVATQDEMPTYAAAGVAGSSARREYERRRAKDEERLRATWGRLGGLAVALSAERQATTAWERGAIGEERLGSRLDGLASKHVAVLHDRRIVGTRANIDHLVVTRGGVWVVDAKRYKGRPELKVEGGILRPRVEKVLVGRRDCTRLVDGVLKQVDRVRDVVDDVPVAGVLCFVEADWPLVGGAFQSRGVQVLWPRRLARVLTSSEARDVDLQATSRLLAARFPPA